MEGVSNLSVISLVYLTREIGLIGLGLVHQAKFAYTYANSPSFFTWRYQTQAYRLLRQHGTK